MITVKTITSGEPSAQMLDMLKQYASVPDDSRDVLLAGLLRRAVDQVQQAADRTIVPSILEVTRTEWDGEPVRLYQDPDDIISAEVDGREVDYTLDGRMLTPHMVGKGITVRYQTKADEATASQLTAVVLQYATALYDGQDTATLTSILNQC